MELTFDLSPERSAVPSARHLVSEALAKLGDETTREDAALIVSELVANAVEHAATPFTVRVLLDHSHVRIEVTDASEQPAEPGNPGPDSERGRGLLVVRALSGRWGVTPTAGGKTVWCELDLPAPREGTLDGSAAAG